MSHNPEKIDKKTLIFLVSIMTIFTSVMLLVFLAENQWTTNRLTFISISVSVTVLIVLTFINQVRFWWAPRVLAFMMHLAVVACILFVLLNEIQLELKESLALSISGLVLGLPSAFYVLWGNSGGKVLLQEYDELTISDRRTFILHQAIKLIAFITVIILSTWFAYESFW